ncbi:helix-turn-helix transcriptional regulator [Paenibacillus sp. strain BS8-2]
MPSTDKHEQGYPVTAVIEPIEQTDFLLMTELNIWFVLSGFLEIIRGGADILIRTGDIFVLNKGDIVRIVSQSTNATLKVQIHTHTYLDELPSFRLNIPLSMVYKKDGYEFMKQSLASLYIEKLYPAAGSEHMIRSYVQRLIGLLYRYLQVADEQELPNPATDKIKEIVSFINIHYAEKLSLDEIAAKFYISKYYLAHTFKNLLGLSVGNYIKEVRLFHSSRFIEQTNEKMVTIALANGFPNIRSFNEAFLSRFGMTPAEYRENSREDKTGDLADSDIAQDVFALFAPYVPLSDYAPELPPSPSGIDVQLDVRQTIGSCEKVNYVLKVKGELAEATLQQTRQRLGIQLVAVSRILEDVGIDIRGGKPVYSFIELDRKLQRILSAGMLPYFQFHSFDYEDWKARGLSNNEWFRSLFEALNRHLRQNYRTSPDWYYEFRCFYEFDHNAELCQPLADIIDQFHSYKKLVIHFPIAPADAITLDQDSEKTVYCIDDLTCMRRIPLVSAMNHLLDQAYPHYINQEDNRTMQQLILDQLQKYEQDDDLSPYSDLVQANSSIWHGINFAQANIAANHYYQPVSLDTAKHFEYFPDELASKLSLCTVDGRYKDNWYAYEFVYRLFDEVVFRNEACIVTKRQEDLRILATYPEQELLVYLNKNNKDQLTSIWQKVKTPHLSIKLALSHLEGTYRIVKQQLTPELSNTRTELAIIRNSEKLSFDDIAYWNGLNRPSRTSEILKIRGDHTLDLEVPLFGIVMIDLEFIE